MTDTVIRRLRKSGLVIYNMAADEIERLRAEVEALRATLHEIAEEWAGAECGEPIHAQEAYAITLAKRMYRLAADALAKEGK